MPSLTLTGPMAMAQGDSQFVKGSLNLNSEEVRAIELTRSRLVQLSHGLERFKKDIYMSNPLPSPYSLQNSARILKQNMSYLLDVLHQHSATFQRVVIYPSTNYPGRTQEGVVMQLLRKKLEPQVETVVESAREEALAAGIDLETSFKSKEDLQKHREQVKRARLDAKFQKYQTFEHNNDDSDSDGEGSQSSEDGVPEPLGLGDVWLDSRNWCHTRLGEFVRDDYNDMYTAEERAMGIEKVRTGLKQNLEEDEDDEEEDDDDGTGGDQAITITGPTPVAASSGVPDGQAVQQLNADAARPTSGDLLETTLWFSARGDDELPSSIGHANPQLGSDPKRRLGDR